MPSDLPANTIILKWCSSSGEDGEPRDRFVELEFTNLTLTVSLAPDGPLGVRAVSQLWSHTAYELEKLVESLSFVLRDELPQFYEVRSKEMLIGPKVGLQPSLQVQIGHPGIGSPGRGAVFYVSKLRSGRRGPDLIEVEVTCAGRAVHGSFGVDVIAEFSELLYDQAKRLAERFVPDSPHPDDGSVDCT